VIKVAGRLPSKHEALSSNHSIIKKKKNASSSPIKENEIKLFAGKWMDLEVILSVK
jgi:hypothetical protein